MKHTFDVRAAVEYGLEEAIVLENFYYWIKKNQANEKHFYDGRYWTYNSQEALSALFPYWNRAKVQRILQRLCDKSLMVKGNYNKVGYDRTTWYSLTDKALFIFEQSIVQNCTIHCSDMNNPLFRSEQPIPDNKPYINTDINTNTCVYSAAFEEFWKVYPRKVNKKGSWQKYATCLRKGYTDQQLLSAAQEYACECEEQQTNEVYIKHAATFLGPSEAFVDYADKAAAKVALAERIRLARESAAKQRKEEERKAKEMLDKGDGLMIWDIIGKAEDDSNGGTGDSNGGNE